MMETLQYKGYILPHPDEVEIAINPKRSGVCTQIFNDCNGVREDCKKCLLSTTFRKEEHVMWLRGKSKSRELYRKYGLTVTKLEKGHAW